MTPLSRWLRISFRVLWILICLDLAVFWIRSYWVADAVSQTVVSATSDPDSPFVRQETSVGLQQGEVVGRRSLRAVKELGSDSGWQWIHPPIEAIDCGPTFLNRLGFAILTQQVPGYSDVRVLSPIWFSFVLSIVPPIVWVARALRKKSGMRVVAGRSG
jgi:hypothetical protein